MLDIRQTHQYAKHLLNIGWKVERIEDVNYFIKPFLFIGSIIKIQRPEIIDINTINNISNKHKAFQIIIEPKDKTHLKSLKSNNFKKTKNTYLPSKTLHLNLIPDKKTLLTEMKKDARSSIRKSKDLKIKSISTEQELELFKSSWKKAIGVKRHVPNINNLISLKKSFRGNSQFYLSGNHNSGAIFLIGDKTSYYWQAFSNKEARSNLEQYQILWKGVCWAKEKGVKIFDFEGIYDARHPNKSWLGFTHFKKSFGGYEVEYPETYTRISLVKKFL